MFSLLGLHSHVAGPSSVFQARIQTLAHASPTIDLSFQDLFPPAPHCKPIQASPSYQPAGRTCHPRPQEYFPTILSLSWLPNPQIHYSLFLPAILYPSLSRQCPYNLNLTMYDAMSMTWITSHYALATVLEPSLILTAPTTNPLSKDTCLLFDIVVCIKHLS